ncbi:MAG TPA: DUF523 domain-containing protein [Lentisphaeria bacterium]|nr:DUF523 domain-containing protein [Lentisphaeria bacterium]
MASHTEKPLILISSCLLGMATRYDGRSKPSPVILSELGSYVSWLPVCPEADSGMGTPRPPMRVIRQVDGSIGLVRPADGFDPAPMLRAWIERTLPALLSRRPDAAILKARSPSCGLKTVAVLDAKRPGVTFPGDGLFAAALRQAAPELPIFDENALATPEQCQQFLRQLTQR